MSLVQQAMQELSLAQEYFNRSTRNLGEELSTYAPAEGVMTAAQQVAHAAHTVGWFMDGAFGAEGFNMDFEGHARIVMGYTSLAAAKAFFDKEIEAAKALVGTKSDADLMMPLSEGPIMGGAPRMAVFGALTDHTAHHRGALTIYARLNGVVPPMPYMDM